MSLAVFQSIGVTELLIVLGVVLLIFGPKRLPMLGRQLGSGFREFRASVTRKADKDDDEDEELAAIDAAGTETTTAGEKSKSAPTAGERS